MSVLQSPYEAKTIFSKKILCLYFIKTSIKIKKINVVFLPLWQAAR